jgi:hypothetical protein
MDAPIGARRPGGVEVERYMRNCFPDSIGTGGVMDHVLSGELRRGFFSTGQRCGEVGSS